MAKQKKTEEKKTEEGKNEKKIKKEKNVEKKIKTEETKEKEKGLHIPVSESVGKSFQKDDYDNFRIVVDGKESDWVEYQGIATIEVDSVLYIGVSKYQKGRLPTETILKLEKVEGKDEKREKEKNKEDYVKIKIVDKSTGKSLEAEDIEDVLNSVLKHDFNFTIKE